MQDRPAQHLRCPSLEPHWNSPGRLEAHQHHLARLPNSRSVSFFTPGVDSRQMNRRLRYTDLCRDAPPFTTLPPPDHNLTSGYFICGHFKDANIDAIKQGVAYLRDVPGRPGMPPGPGSCGRVSCSDKSAICKSALHGSLLRSHLAVYTSPVGHLLSERLLNKGSTTFGETADVTIIQTGATITMTASQSTATAP